MVRFWLGTYNKINNQYKIIQKVVTFIVHFKGGHMETYSNYYDENEEYERDAAWDNVFMTFPNADYIVEF